MSIWWKMLKLRKGFRLTFPVANLMQEFSTFLARTLQLKRENHAYTGLLLAILMVDLRRSIFVTRFLFFNLFSRSILWSEIFFILLFFSVFVASASWEAKPLCYRVERVSKRVSQIRVLRMCRNLKAVEEEQ